MTEMWRLFIALELPEPIVATLTEIQARLKQEAPPRTVRWTNSRGIHLTLKFLGDAPVTQLDELESALRSAVQGHTSFDLAMGGVGCFPNTKRPRVIWVGLPQAPQTLFDLRDAVERHIAPLGYPTESRPFSPHLTLGRVRKEAARSDVIRLGEIVDAARASTSRWTIDGVSLMRSELRPDGAVYSQVAYAQLGNGE